MEFTKAGVAEQITSVLTESSGRINPSVITQKLKWNKDAITEICTLFEVKKFSEVLGQIPEVEIQKDENGTAYVQFSQTEKQSNATTEEKTMAENETKSQNLHDRIKNLRDALINGLYEKDEALRLALLTAIAGESVFFLGAPGCAKSMIARRVVQAFKADGDKGVKYFETLLNQFSTPEEVFGNISLKALNGELEDEKGNKKEEYRRLTENMLPEADIAFLDEIWKASPAILNTLLTITNERIFHNGSKVEKVPLKALFAASNELPAKGRGLEALYDRFILRLCVGYIENEDSFFDMIDGSSSSDFALPDEVKNLQITNEELKAWKEKIDAVSLSDEAKAIISAIRKELTSRNEKLTEENKNSKDFEWQRELFEVGDRRWKKIAHILKASAFLNDRTEVDLMDCQLIEYCIWSTEKQQKQARDIVEKCIKQNGVDCDSAIEEIQEQIEEFKAAVDEAWFEKVKEPATDKIVTIDGQKCYECTRDGTSETWYVSVECGRHYSYSSYHDVYNGTNYHTHSTFSKTGNKISCWDTFTIKKNPAKTHVEAKKFSDIAYETLQKKFKQERYVQIVDRINKQIEELKSQKEQDAVPFKANLFANQEYNTSITAKIDAAIQELEDAGVALDKQQNRYFNTNLSASLSVGDVLLKNGTIYTAGEIDSLSAEEKENVIAVVCLAGEKAYALGIEQYKDTWDNTAKKASDYGSKNELPSKYASGWAVPDKDLLSKIWENRELINKSLEAVGNELATLTAEEYWSSSKNGESAAFYQLFDDRGHQDHTTKDHEYAVCLVREWKKE
ncbi:AAA family ATPase [uncultured Treponema sp.]|uniref:AAA family ATPase n=1 Tax=uncultured Treponema sp. TaxID=162155 RepID=UPI0025FA2DC1|nr:AAA family ATPase [uncultured Treponema sp.]